MKKVRLSVTLLTLLIVGTWADLLAVVDLVPFIVSEGW
jgi:hypothetical protein